MRLFCISIFLFFAFLTNTKAYAESFLEAVSTNHEGHLKLQGTYSDFQSDNIESITGDSEPTVGIVDFRLKNTFSFKNFKAVFHGEMLGLYDERDNNSPLTIDSTRLPNDSRRALRLSFNIDENASFSSVARLDRAYLEYQNDDVSVRLGRQSISWGNGLLFSVFDFFNPFSPTEIDRDYKPGDDMFFSAYNFGDQDLEFVSVIRRDLDGSLRSDNSSFGTRFHQSFYESEIDLDLIAAQHFDQTHLGFGASKSIFSGILRLDALWVEGEQLSTILNYDRTWVVLDRNLYGFIEYYRSGFADSNGSFNPAVIERLERGELFVSGRDFISLGSRFELTPLIGSYNSLINNINDFSSIYQTRFDFDLFQNASVSIGANIAIGPTETEFGGRNISALGLASPGTPGSGSFGPANSFYIRLAHFF